MKLDLKYLKGCVFFSNKPFNINLKINLILSQNYVDVYYKGCTKVKCNAANQINRLPINRDGSTKKKNGKLVQSQHLKTLRDQVFSQVE